MQLRPHNSSDELDVFSQRIVKGWRSLSLKVGDRYKLLARSSTESLVFCLPVYPSQCLCFASPQEGSIDFADAAMNPCQIFASLVMSMCCHILSTTAWYRHFTEHFRYLNILPLLLFFVTVVYKHAFFLLFF